MVTIGKDGTLWKLDRASGKIVDFIETLPQNIFEPLDRKTGRLKYRQDIIDAKIGDPVSVCPGIYGGHNWQARVCSASWCLTQYVAVPTGMGVFKLLTAKQAAEIYQPNGGNALYVFRLP